MEYRTNRSIKWCLRTGFFIAVSLLPFYVNADIGLASREPNKRSALREPSYRPKGLDRDSRLPANDCSETPMSQQDFIAGLSDVNKTNINDYVQSIPEGTLQNFTLIYQTSSPLETGITEKLPRVLRWSNDGKIIIAYACDPKAQSYGEVKAEIYDDKTRSFKLMKRYLSPKPELNHFDSDQSKCVECHGGTDPRPNWGGYEDWPGVFGSFQDDLPEKDRLHDIPNVERKNFLAFREKQLDNPCYKSLPWGKFRDRLPNGKFDELNLPRFSGHEMVV